MESNRQDCHRQLYFSGITSNDARIYETCFLDLRVGVCCKIPYLNVCQNESRGVCRAHKKSKNVQSNYCLINFFSYDSEDFLW